MLVYGGQISFCLYMVHELVHTAWDWVAAQFELTLAGYVGKLVVIGLLRSPWSARLWCCSTSLKSLRGGGCAGWLMSARPKTDGQIDPAAAEPVQGKLRSIDGAAEDRPKPAARARCGVTERLSVSGELPCNVFAHTIPLTSVRHTTMSSAGEVAVRRLTDVRRFASSRVRRVQRTPGTGGLYDILTPGFRAQPRRGDRRLLYHRHR